MYNFNSSMGGLSGTFDGWISFSYFNSMAQKKREEKTLACTIPRGFLSVITFIIIVGVRACT